MQIESLKFFFEVASVKSISKVAKSSLISQSALSQQIQRLEDNLGYKLLERSNRGVELTEAGQIVEKYAKNVLLTYDNMIEDLNNKSKNDNTIRIDSVLPCTLYRVNKKFSSHKYVSSSNFSDDVEQNITNDICDVGFIYDKPNDLSI
jgi:DNA-binding transcriptional LysR family regulator